MNGSAGLRRVACLFFPLWPVQRLVVTEPSLRGSCVILYRQDARRGQVVHAASPLAWRRGVCHGMPLAEARSLVGARQAASHAEKSPAKTRNSPAVIRPADPAADREALQTLALQLHLFSPLVGLESSGGIPVPDGSPQVLLLDVSGLTHLFGGEAGWCTAVREWLLERSWHVRMAVADTVGAAWALATASLSSFDGMSQATVDDPSQATVSLAADEPPADPARQQLDRLPIEALRVESPLCDALADVGVQTISQLRRLPRASLTARFGDSLARRLDQLDGCISETICAVTPADSLSATTPLEHPLSDRRTLVVLIQQLVSATARRLVLRQQGALRWRVLLSRYQAENALLELHLFSPVTADRHLQQLVEMHVEQLRDFHSLQHPVTAVTVTAVETVRIAERQTELFAAREGRTDHEAVGMLINRLAARLGPAQVVRPQVLAEPQPELAGRFHPLAGSRVLQRSPRPASAAATPGPLERPLRLFRDPLPVAVKLDPAGVPQEVVASSGTWQVTLASGPERIETGWWRKPLVRREYWRIETRTSRRLWLAHDLRNDNWWVWGEF